MLVKNVEHLAYLYDYIKWLQVKITSTGKHKPFILWHEVWRISCGVSRPEEWSCSVGWWCGVGYISIVCQMAAGWTDCSCSPESGSRILPYSLFLGSRAFFVLFQLGWWCVVTKKGSQWSGNSKEPKTVHIPHLCSADVDRGVCVCLPPPF